jgi:hypothetical protein
MKTPLVECYALHTKFLTGSAGPVAALLKLVEYRRPVCSQPLGGLLNTEAAHPGCAFVGFNSLPGLLQVFSRQRLQQQGRWLWLLWRCSCVLGVMARAAGFVAGQITPGFTVRYAGPPSRGWHLTHYL